MFKLGILALLVIGCGEVTPAGGIGLGGAGGTTETDASGSAGATGAGGAQAGGAGTAAMPSCNIPLDQVSGAASEVTWIKCGAQQSGMISATVTNGSVGNVFGEWPTVGSYTAAPDGDGCGVDIRYERPPAASCSSTTPDRLFVHLTVPAI